MSEPFYIRIAGAKNSGKTTLIVALIAELTARGFRVATLKHTSHDHEFDRRGSDSQRHGAAGSAASVIVSPGRFVCHAQRPPADELSRLLRCMYAGCDVILCEGYTDLSPGDAPAPLIECVAPGEKTFFADDADIVALVASDDLSTGLPVFERTQI
ncbi:MAG: molybdopterin-guanine dinucleotide biosynthesis protein B, partial [bacterium]